ETRGVRPQPLRGRSPSSLGNKKSRKKKSSPLFGNGTFFPQPPPPAPPGGLLVGTATVSPREWLRPEAAEGQRVPSHPQRRRSGLFESPQRPSLLYGLLSRSSGRRVQLCGSRWPGGRLQIF